MNINSFTNDFHITMQMDGDMTVNLVFLNTGKASLDRTQFSLSIMHDVWRLNKVSSWIAVVMLASRPDDCSTSGPHFWEVSEDVLKQTCYVHR